MSCMTSHDHGVAFDAAGRETRQFHGGGGSEWHFRNFLHAVRRRSCRELNADIEEGHVTSALGASGQHLVSVGTPDVICQRHSATHRTPLAATCWPMRLDRMQLHLRENGVDTHTASLRLGARLTCDPATETILNHAPANRSADP